MLGMLEQIKADVEKHPIILYMKGSKLMPMCGFSAQVVEILFSLGVPFETRNVLEDDQLRSSIKEFSNWPTLPQLYIKGEFIGGCDVVTELFESGQLQKMVT
ncbi:MAG: Grx4 family monothiol glutaredoxin [Chlamydiia bacterium]|nr:Grx4 family monothiol glutaredoxin [Chlamydiia bacterium]MCP5508985.1 Grx4 family monothiol glutaredoxin [Chlamydiales bacterium]